MLRRSSSLVLKSFYFLPLQARLDFCFKVILPSITYGILVWGNAGKTILDDLERIHIRAARIICHYASDKSSQEVQRQTNWKPLKLYNNLRLLKLVFKYHQDLLPITLQDLFSKREQVYNFGKRNCLKLPKCGADCMKKFIAYQGAILWNSLDNSARSLNSYTALKTILLRTCSLGSF